LRDIQSEVQVWFSGSGQGTGLNIQDIPGRLAAAFSVHDDKPLEYLNKIFFGQKDREPRHDEVNRATECLHACRPEPEGATDKSNRKKYYLDILGAVFRTEKAAASLPGISCILSPVPCPLLENQTCTSLVRIFHPPIIN